VRRIKIAGLEIQLDRRERETSPAGIFKTMNGWNSAQKEGGNVAIDEAQYLKLAGRTGTIGCWRKPSIT
jgi:hypothetical protein